MLKSDNWTRFEKCVNCKLCRSLTTTTDQQSIPVLLTNIVAMFVQNYENNTGKVQQLILQRDAVYNFAIYCR